MSPSPRVCVVGGDDVDGIAALLAGLLRAPCSVVICSDSDGLEQRVKAATALPVTAVTQTATLELEQVYVLPRGVAASIHDGLVRVDGEASVGRLDRVLRTLSESYGRDALVVIVGGLGTDGVLGIKRVKEFGGVVLVEEPLPGVLSEKPRAVIATGFVDQVATRAELPGKLVRLLAIAAGEEDETRREDDSSDTLRDILTLVRIRSGHDFTSYKRATMYRRVARRMQVCQTDTIGDYQRHLRDHPQELQHLLRDFLISVTNFFRDPDAYDVVARQVIPKLFADRGPSDQVRAWVAGCATGEEAYSLGILMLEHARTLNAPPRFQIFATDIDDDALAEARAGRYPETIAADVSPERRHEFFVREGNTYRVTQELRELILFSPHNLLRDPPFSRLDLVSCRNLLIYLNREAQTRVLSVFHFGLRPEGYLFLGSSESAESSSMFTAYDARYRVFNRRAAPTALGMDTLLGAGRWSPPNHAVAPSLPVERTTSVGELHHRLVERYAPPSILINGELDIVHVSEHAGRFLEVSGGEPTRNILRLIITQLRLELRTAIYATRQTRTTDTRRITFEDRGKTRTLEMRVRALELPELGPNAVLIYLDELDTPGDAPAPSASNDTLIEPVVREIEDELHRTRDQLRNTVEQYETSLEELKASNEELQAINEELRSASEELETSKEELQSVNEELTTLNHELKVKIDEVSHANSDLQNLMTSTDIGVVFLDRSMNLKRFTPRALDLFNMIPSDIGRPLAHVTHRLMTSDLPALAQGVLQNLRTVERDVYTHDGRPFLLRILPYRSLEDRIEGVVLTFIDVSDLRDAIEGRKKSEAALQTTGARLGLALRGAPVIALSVNSDLRITWGVVLGKEVPAGPIAQLDLFEPEWEMRFSAACRSVFAKGTGQRVEIELWIDKALHTYDVRLERTDGEVLAIGFDITPRKREETALRDADRRKDEFLATLSHELRGPLAPLKMALEVARLANGDKAKLEQTHGVMERQVSMLTSLVDELLDLSRITQGKLVIARERIAVSEIIDEALEITRPLLSEHKHELEVKAQADLFVSGDRGRLVQMLTNLVTNAAKYTPDGGAVEIRTHADARTKRVVIEVRDNGVGIPQETLSHIFELFAQNETSRDRSKGGLGIGLNLVRRIVELHGGSVEAHSAGQDEGSLFVVSLPSA